MIEVLKIIADSWPIAIMVMFLFGTFVINRRWAQHQEDNAAIYNLRTNNALVVRDRDE